MHVPPSSERLNGLALLMTIHKDIHFKYDDVIDPYVVQQNRRLQCE